MRRFCEQIWNAGEYDYRAAYGFIPEINAYLHDDDINRDCMIVVPGGGYCMCVPHEGELPAEVFYEQGMNVFVLTYTTDITMSIPLKKQPLNDISRAVRYVRKRAKEYNIEGTKLFVCGFSAGAHVCGSLAVHFDDVTDVDPEYEKISNRPDGVILSYPVITTGEYTHEFSVQTLLGKDASKEELEYFSLEKNVKDNTPSCFLWQTQTDELVPVKNSYLFAEALKENGISYAHYVFPDGFHGLSVANASFFGKWSGGEYTMKQVLLAVDAVKAGKGIDVSQQRQNELKIQFADGFKSEPPEGFVFDDSLVKDVGMWPELAKLWMAKVSKE